MEGMADSANRCHNQAVTCPDATWGTPQAWNERRTFPPQHWPLTHSCSFLVVRLRRRAAASTGMSAITPCTFVGSRAALALILLRNEIARTLLSALVTRAQFNHAPPINLDGPMCLAVANVLCLCLLICFACRDCHAWVFLRLRFFHSFTRHVTLTGQAALAFRFSYLTRRGTHRCWTHSQRPPEALQPAEKGGCIFAYGDGDLVSSPF